MVLCVCPKAHLCKHMLYIHIYMYTYMYKRVHKYVCTYVFVICIGGRTWILCCVAMQKARKGQKGRTKTSSVSWTNSWSFGRKVCRAIGWSVCLRLATEADHYGASRLQVDAWFVHLLHTVLGSSALAMHICLQIWIISGLF